MGINKATLHTGKSAVILNIGMAVIEYSQAVIANMLLLYTTVI